MKGRPVRIKFKKFNGRDAVLVETVARFHCWGYRKSKVDARSSVQETVAVCELEDGSVRLVIPERLQFLDKKA